MLDSLVYPQKTITSILLRKIYLQVNYQAYKQTRCRVKKIIITLLLYFLNLFYLEKIQFNRRIAAKH